MHGLVDQNVRRVYLQIDPRALVYQILSQIRVLHSGYVLLHPGEDKVYVKLVVDVLGELLLILHDVDFVLRGVVPDEFEVLNFFHLVLL
jgi:hypothetical protein